MAVGAILGCTDKGAGRCNQDQDLADQVAVDPVNQRRGLTLFRGRHLSSIRSDEWFRTPQTFVEADGLDELEGIIKEEPVAGVEPADASA